MHFNQLHYGKEHNFQQGCRALEGRQETVCQEVDIRSVCTPHPESSPSGAGRGNGYHGGTRAGSRQPQIGIRPVPKDREGHPDCPQDDSPFRGKVWLLGITPDRHPFPNRKRQAGHRGSYPLQSAETHDICP